MVQQMSNGKHERIAVQSLDGVPQHVKPVSRADLRQLGRMADATTFPHFGYGTAGFRSNADSPPMDWIFFRMGILAALRSQHFAGMATGIMVTASHNPPQDNGIKIVDPFGCVMDPNLEKTAEEFVNASEEDFPAVVEKAKASDMLKPSGNNHGLVIVGRDTRVSSERFVKCVIRGAVKMGAHFEDYGTVHTPLVHHLVRMVNGFDNVSWASLGGYYDMLEMGLRELLDCSENGYRGSNGRQARHTILVDAANGVGGITLPGLLERMGDVLCCHIQNRPSKPSKLNVGCGAEFVHKSHCPPKNYTTKSDVPFCCSFDGDADRLIFHYFDQESQWKMLDGDKITCLLTSFVQQHLKDANIGSVSFGVMQNSYANGASSNFLRSKGVEICLVKTGVKHMEHAAKDYDVACLFESNGHGTVLISDKVRDLLSEPCESRTRAGKARKCLLALRKVCNQAVGDAISMLFAVVGVLVANNMTIEDWDGLYTDLPCVQAKVKVPDRKLAVPNDTETRLIEPQVLQDAIDKLVKTVPDGRAFVRPSGTEDIIRVYAEAATEKEANQLADAVKAAVVNEFGDTGYNPSRETSPTGRK